jgi:hypothetical protein
MNQDTLYVVVIWDDHQDSESFAYAVAATDTEAAQDRAIALHLSMYESDREHLKVDNDLTFDITTVSNSAGQIYNVLLVKSVG